MMKRSFVAGVILTSVLAGSAMAADIPTKVPVYRSPPVEVFSWSGIYVGGHLGYGWSSNEWRVIGDNSILPSFNLGSGTIIGALGGVQAGVNWQTGPVVLGVEVDFSWADMSGDICNFSQVPGASFVCSSKVDRFGTITGRIGGAFDRTLLYLKAGGAWVRHTHMLDIVTAPPFDFQQTISKSQWGFTGGAGVEHAITHNWSAKLEYDFLLFGAERYVFAASPTIGADVNADIKQRVHTVKLGFNYRFDWSSPVAARY
jgi:opacity protein-like surface antigen